jgi:ABC-2 type transport system permease protein
LFLAAVFTAIGICCSSLTSNAVVSFLLSAFACFVIYSAFSALSTLPVFETGSGYFIEMLGIDSHYRSISRGVIDSRDIVYFATVVLFFLFLTARNLVKR